jgi:hypothetical protein
VSRESKQQVVTGSYITITTEYACDKCGRKLDPDDCDDACAHELIVWLDQSQYVNFYRQRDYCPACLEPVWRAINALIGADSDIERDREYE